MDIEKKTVSIGLPVYNGEKYIRQALDSLLAQDFTDFELIISDNASTDNTGKICSEYANKYSQISYHCNPKKMGSNWNFNNAFSLTSGKYFLWAAHDDIWDPTFLHVLENHPEYILVFCHYDNIGLNNMQIQTWEST